MVPKTCRLIMTSTRSEPSVLEPLFLDTSYLLALVNRRDQNHFSARQLATRFGRHPTVVTQAVFLEFANALAARFRSEAARVIRELESDELCEVIAVSEPLFEAALSFYESRNDQEWGLVDCVSFVVMRNAGLQSALTFDHHFEQAGFRVCELEANNDNPS